MKGKVIPCRGAEDGKGTRINSGKSGTRNLEAGSIRSRAERMGGHVKMKTDTEIRRSSAQAHVCKVGGPPPSPPGGDSILSYYAALCSRL